MSARSLRAPSGRYRCVLCAALLACAAALPAVAAAQGQGSITGMVLDAATGRPLANADVQVVGTSRQALTSGEGRFAFTGVPSGTYTVRAATLAYAGAEVQVQLLADQTITVELRLSSAPIALADLIVTPGHFGIAHEQVSRPQMLRRAQIERMPQLGDDVFRTVNRLPGMGSHEFKARFTVRGGDDESVLVMLDGLELFEPYHLKDFDGSLSILDVAAIGGVDLTTGGFSAAYGNHLTGIFDLSTTSRITPRPRTQLALSLGNVRAMSQGSFAGEKGLWLFSARRGYLDILLALAGQEADMDPRYYDLLGKVVYQLGERHTLSAHALHAGDRSTLRDDDGQGLLTSRYGSSYAWLSWDARVGERITVETLASAGSMAWERQAEENDGGTHFEIEDDRGTSFTSLRQDWQAELSDALVLRGGLDARFASAEYDYFNLNLRHFVQDSVLRSRYDSTRVDTRPDGREVGVYLLQRLRIWEPLIVETGVRWDGQSVTEESQWSPRLNAVLMLGGSTTLRAGWGRYAQPQRLHQLSVRDGERDFATAELANQLVAGIERDLGAGIRVRGEAYRRTESRLRPRYLNLSAFVEPVAEVESDRFRVDRESATAEGLELFAQRQGERSSWMASYALARAEDLVDGRRVPRPLEQRHTLYLDHSFVPRPGWQLSWSWQIHSGWPATAVSFSSQRLRNGDRVITQSYGDYHGERLPVYHRLDVRASRDITLRTGRLNFFLDVFNLYNRKNPQAYRYNVRFQGGQLNVTRGYETLLPIMPSVGVMWEL